jgi:hypothetical protein
MRAAPHGGGGGHLACGCGDVAGQPCQQRKVIITEAKEAALECHPDGCESMGRENSL